MARRLFSPYSVFAGMAVTLIGLTACGSGAPSATVDAKMSVDSPANAESGTASSSLDPVLASPQTGDVYAAELTAFSTYDFNEGAPERAGQKSYGLMKVVEVSDDRITVVTESAAWPAERGALSDLRGTMSDITWDDSERIPINRADLAKHVEDGKIIETRRMTAE